MENVRRHSRFHPRCGTSFLFLVILIGIVLYAVLPWESTALRVVYKLLLLPVLVGVSYEVIKWAGRSKSRGVFADGAVQAALFVDGAQPGFYTMTDMLRGKMQCL